ncbi:thiopeptide-type bacteriocin biosynthesis protein [Pseudalkalibacillus sp. JSM 102089]|uniref:thiopeptide-type bacteriocin biosynthesis protein n=1 Tax=Pseudalkalibacillus sp. JSM 102089 TaxID=3229856 RepID=UPI003525601E
MYRWLSIHVFYHDISRQNQLIYECLESLFKDVRNKEYVKKYFFMRYWEGGPHIRVRFYVRNEKYDLLESFVTEYIDNYLKKSPSMGDVDVKAYYSNLMVGEKREYSKVIHQNNSVKNVTYYQEYKRYGGREAMKLAQSLFQISSDLTCAILSNYRKKEEVLSIAKDLMYVTFLSYSELSIDAVRYFKNYSNYYKVYTDNEGLRESFIENSNEAFSRNKKKYVSHVKNLFERVLSETAGAASSKDLYLLWFMKHKEAYKELRKIHEEGNLINPLNGESVEDKDLEKVLQSITHSYMHMNNNRLGVNFFEESYLAFILSESVTI